MSNSTITLYDVASREDKPSGWNAMSIKARLSLNFKGVQYRTVWLEYPEIEPTMKRIGAGYSRTKPDGSPLYTIPVLVDPAHVASDGKPIPINDSWKITEYLDEKYPGSGQLFPKGTKALQSLFHDYISTNILVIVSPLTACAVLNILHEASHAHWRAPRESAYHVKLEDLCPKGSDIWEEKLSALKKGFSNLNALLENNEAVGPFVLGAQVTFSDIIIISILEMMSKVIPEEWEKTIQHWDDGRWQRMRENCASWIQSDNVH